MGDTNQIAAQLHLSEAVKNNNEVVLKQLYDECYPKIEMYILKNNGTRPQAKDIFQEAFIATWQNVKDSKFVPKNESALQGYLYQIAKNKWIDFLRSSRFKKTVSIKENIQLEQTENEDPLVSNDDVKLALDAFNSLEDECRKLLTHFYFEKKSLREIAIAFSIGEASARNKKYRCINKLKALVKSPN